jgi:hypothetical protein
LSKLNSCQKPALNNLINWFNGKEQFCILQGEAGTGKTYLIKYFLEVFKGTRAFLGAETNEAVAVLAEATNYVYTYGTVCNLLNLRICNEKEHKVLKQYAEPNLENIDLIILDEASMLDKFKLDLLKQLGKKILFVGHKSQLPPIIKNISLTDQCLPPVFEENFSVFTLKTIERNKGALQKFIQQTEKSIYENIPATEDFRITRDFFKKDILGNAEELEKIANSETAILCYTNSAAENYNNKFRRAYFGVKAADEAEFLERDKIILRTPTAAFSKDISKCNGVSAILNKNNIFAILPTNSRAEVLKVTNCIILKVPSFRLKVKVFLQSETCETLIFVPQDWESFEEFKRTYYYAALFEKIEHLAEKKWKLYHDIEKIFGNTKHAYARTIHTAQGSTIDNVIVDDTDIDKCHNVFLRKKLRYVAYSRAKLTLRRKI